MSSDKKAEQPQTIYRKDYKKPDYLVDDVELEFDLDETATKVTSTINVRSEHDRKGGAKPLFLDGDELKLLSISMNGKKLEKSDYELDDKGLTIPNPPTNFSLKIETEINPKANTRLEGLYLSNGVFTTQNEANGFPRITFFPNHPDIMSTYKTTIRADKDKLPIMLSNGSPVDEGELEDGRHFATWVDPHKKPPSLYALVAGDLAYIEDKFKTMSGKEIPLRIHIEKGKEERCRYAMASLKKAMKWDEEKFGREYDLDVFNIVAVAHHNYGAMENKALNIFNDKALLAGKDKATDAEHAYVERIVAHEYFHNWTGNRVGLENWFNLTLKEGLTSYRDQEFSADMRSRSVKRIEDVAGLRASQFPEDAGPMAHSIRPDSYVSVSNFYTPTVYKKGAEVIRMMEKIVGKDGFRKGTDLFFERHDGQATTCDNFVKAIGDANKTDLSKFLDTWYSQAGTPEVTAKGKYDAKTKTYELKLSQKTPPTLGQKNKKPCIMPIEVGLLDSKGKDIAVAPDGKTSRILILENEEQTFTFKNINETPVLSVNRGFTAPVKMNVKYSDKEYLNLMTNDSDSFNRWDAGQQYATKKLLKMVSEIQSGKEPKVDEKLVNAFGSYLDEKDKAFIVEAMTIPSERALADNMKVVDVEAIHKARTTLVKAVAEQHKDKFIKLYNANGENGAEYVPDEESSARRSLKNCALSFLAKTGKDKLAVNQYNSADNANDKQAALNVLANSDSPERKEALNDFYEQNKDDQLMINKWFAVQASSSAKDTLKNVKELIKHEAFTLANPNTASSVVGVFSSNQVHFHAKDGSGYEFMANQMIKLDDINQMSAANMITPLLLWKRQNSERQELMKKALKRVLEKPNLSQNVYEKISKSLADDKTTKIRHNKAKTKITAIKETKTAEFIKKAVAKKSKQR